MSPRLRDFISVLSPASLTARPLQTFILLTYCLKSHLSPLPYPSNLSTTSKTTPSAVHRPTRISWRPATSGGGSRTGRTSCCKGSAAPPAATCWRWRACSCPRSWRRRSRRSTRTGTARTCASANPEDNPGLPSPRVDYAYRDRIFISERLHRDGKGHH